ncbi:Gfo/Idh/MocA family protein [Haladaptatus halobius]|uniref:Gfo/Idh/MocA family protein n=1 Tax=Haladaptatus halobius TaxID=2884875 RepID=UPI001D0A5534|nr:Gfo/Idh/MocA family oxidoreductase [Haladaptatus halobius]
MGTRLGAIGLGGLGSIELDILADIDGVEIVAGADVSVASREAFESAHGAPAYEKHNSMLEAHGDKLDAVSIVTPHTLHYEQAMDCLRAGVDVFVEKPMATGIENAVDLVETADELDRVLQVGYQRHFHPLFRELKKTVESGRIGDVHMVNCYLGQEWISIQKGTWRTNPSLSGGGQLYDSGSHLLDALLWTTDSRPASVATVTDTRGHDVDVNSALAATLERDGKTITASIGVTGDGSKADPHEGIVIWGTDGRIDYHDGEMTVVDADGTTHVREDESTTGFRQLTRRKLAAFVQVVEGEREPAVSGQFGLQVTALTEAAYESAATGETVNVGALLERVREAREERRTLQGEAE